MKTKDQAPRTKYHVLIALLLCGGFAACKRSETPTPAVATPSVTLSRTKVPLGAPMDITYRFVVAADAPPFTEKNRVFVHVVDTDEKLMWTDDHDPPTPTTEWKPGQTIEYVRTVFIPVRPYIGGASIHLGLYSPSTQRRLTLSGQDSGQHAYNVASLEIQPQSEAVFTVMKDGWHSAETPPNNDQVEWSWTSKNQATIAFKNPKKDAIFYLDLDNPSNAFPDGQHVQVTLGAKTVDDFVVHSARELRKIAIAAGAFGAEDMVELKVGVDKVFVPAQLNPAGSKDGRQLGLRVFHAVIAPMN